ncbi:MAG: RecX family transcriptional regulator [Bacteroidetes bacterium]|nr:MAG: RecX family transcriptional regulator [Bacteroidota bacterium]
MKTENSNKTFLRALSKAQYLCSRQEKCLFDIEKKLIEWDVPDKFHEKILRELKREKYIDEKRFAESYVRGKFKINKWGKIKIKHALTGKSINAEIINQAILTEIPDEEYQTVLTNLLYGKNRGIKGPSGLSRLTKLIKYATAKGFEYDLVKKIAEHFTNPY